MGQYGLSDTFKYGAFFSIVLGSFCLAIISLFKGLLSEIEFKDGHVIYVTDIGGLADVDLSCLLQDESIVTKSWMFLVDSSGNKADIHLKLYLASDVERILAYMFNYIDD